MVFGRNRLFLLLLIQMISICSGCVEIATHEILTAGSNGGGIPFPKKLSDWWLFDSMRVVRVQEEPAIDLAVWVIEPQLTQIWSGKSEGVSAPEGWTDKNSGIVSVISKGEPVPLIRIWISWRGEARNAARREALGTVIILQGQGGCVRRHASTWPIAAAMANAGYRVIMPDLRSQGDSTGERLGYIVKDADDVGKIIDMLEREGLLSGRLGILGHSYGAAVAACTMMEDDRVETVIVSGMPACWREISEFQGQQNWLWRMMPDWQHEMVFRKCSLKMGYDIDSIDARQIIRQISKPVLLVHGRLDRQVPVNHSEQMHKSRPENTKLVIYEQNGHGDYFIARFDDFSKLCLDWFATYLKEEKNAHPGFGVESR